MYIKFPLSVQMYHLLGLTVVVCSCMGDRISQLKVLRLLFLQSCRLYNVLILCSVVAAQKRAQCCQYNFVCNTIVGY